MSLLLWYPFTEDKHNQGTLQLPKENLTYGNIAFEDIGKIGAGCANGSLGYHLDEEILGNEWTVATWIKGAGSLAPTSGNAIIFCKNNTTATDTQIYFSFRNINKLNIGINGSNGIITVTTTCIKDTWYHVAATYKKPILSLYLNGELIGNTTVSTTYQNQPEGKLNVMINGRSNDATCTSRTGSWADFRYNDFRLYDECLSKSQIKELSQGLILHYKFDDPAPNMIKPKPKQINIGGAPAYWYDLTENLVPGEEYTTQIWDADVYDAAGKTQFILGTYWEDQSVARWLNLEQTSGHADYLVKTFTAPAFEKDNNDKDIIRKPEFRIYSLPKPDSGDRKTTVSAVKLEKGAIATGWVPYNDPIVVDSSGYGNNGVINGDIQFNGECVYLLDGNNDRIYTPNNLAYFSEGVTTSIWFKGSTKVNQTIISDGTGSTDYEVGVQASGVGRFGIKVGENEQRIIGDTASDVNCLDNEWHMITSVYDNHYLYRYIDGTSYGSPAAEGGLSKSPLGFCFGRYGGSKNGVKQAYLKDARVYCTALSAEDVAQLYNNVVKMDRENNLQTRQLIEKEENNLLKTPWTNYYKTKSVDPHNKFLNYDVIPQFNGLQVSAGSDYIEVQPGTFFWEATISVSKGNNFYLGVERYDANKTTTQGNQGTHYFVHIEPNEDVIQQRFNGSITITTDWSGNPIKYLALRILNGWSGSDSTDCRSTIHSLSLRQYSENTSVDKFGQLSNDWFIEEDGNIQRYKNGVLRANHFVER